MTNEFNAPDDVDDVLDDSVSALIDTDIPEVELPDYDEAQFDLDDDELVVTEEELAEIAGLGDEDANN